MSRESHNAKERAKRIGAKLGCGSFAAPPGSGPWVLKQRPAGDWVVDQLCGTKLRVRRYGPYETRAEAEAKYLDLTAPNGFLSETHEIQKP